VSRSFEFRERWRLSIIGEVFNAYNAANLSGHNGNLINAGFRSANDPSNPDLRLRRAEGVSVSDKEWCFENG